MISIYKPNSSNKGHAAHFSFSPESKCVFVKLVKQSAWNPQTKEGSFKQDSKDPTKSVSAKFSVAELGKFVNSFERRVPLNLYHQSDNGSSKIYLAPKQTKNDKGETNCYFNLTISKGQDLNFFISIDEGEAVLLREGFKMCLTHILKSNIVKSQQDAEKYGKAKEERFGNN